MTIIPQTESLQAELDKVKSSLEQERADYQAETTYLTSQLNEELSARAGLEQKLADSQEEVRLLQKKSASALKVRL